MRKNSGPQRPLFLFVIKGVTKNLPNSHKLVATYYLESRV